jgi:hypothetical protein
VTMRLIPNFGIYGGGSTLGSIPEPSFRSPELKSAHLKFPILFCTETNILRF